MALVNQFRCLECKRERYEVVTASRVCAECRLAISEAKETAHMQRLAALPIEERVRRLELASYRTDADSRLREIEVRNVTY